MPTPAEIEARLAQYGHPPVHAFPTYAQAKYVEPLDAIARRAVEALRAPDGITFGLPEIDLRIRGCRPQDLIFITGFSHSGKTQLVNTMIHNNPERRILFMSLDDPAEMIVTKLAAMKYGISASTLEERVRNGDTTVDNIFNDFANAYPNLIITDKHLGIETMGEAVDEATAIWRGESPHVVIVDYLELIDGDHDGESAGVKAMAKDLQVWAKRNSWPTVVLHQGTRSNAKPGAPITLTSMAFGGEQQATIVIGVRRKRDWPDLDLDERVYHANSVTLHVVKNKRPGGRLTQPDGEDFYMDPDTGLIARWSQTSHGTSATSLVKQVQAHIPPATLEWGDDDD